MLSPGAFRVVGVRLVLLGGVSGQRQEDLVEAGVAQGELGDDDARVVEASHDLRQEGRVGDGCADRLSLDLRLGPGELGDDRAYGGQVRRLLGPDGERLGTRPGLELGGRAAGDHAAAVDDRDVVGQGVGLLEVLRGEQDRDAVGHELTHLLPQAQPRAGVEARGRFVEKEDFGAADKAGREVEAAAHPTGVRLGGAPRRVLQLERREQLAGALPGVGTRHAE